MAEFEVVLAARVPTFNTFPTLTIVNRLVVDNFSYTEELNRPGVANLSAPIRALSDDVKARLVDLASFPSEVWIYADSTRVWTGEIQTFQMQNQTLTINAVGVLGYTFRMGVTFDLVYTAVDQFTIATGLIQHWQNLNYGDYGIDTFPVGTSGVVRDRTYLRDELHNIGTRLAELCAVSNGFDMKVDPASRDLVLSYPQSGTDLSGSIFLDERNIDDSSIAISVAPEDLVSDVAATGTSADTGGINTKFYTLRTTPAVQSGYGRSWAGVNFDGVSVQSTLDGHADAYKNARANELLQPGVTIIPRVGVDIGSFHAGDTVTYSYDAGLGLQVAALRVSKVTTRVESNGRQRMSVEFT